MNRFRATNGPAPSNGQRRVPLAPGSNRNAFFRLRASSDNTRSLPPEDRVVPGGFAAKLDHTDALQKLKAG